MNFLETRTCRALFCAAGGFAAITLGAQQALAQTPTVWQLAHTLTVPGSLYEKIITEEIPARVAKASGGMVQVKPVIGVITTNDVLNALRRDRVQMGSLTVAYSAATYPLWAVLNLPGLVNDPEQIAPIARQVVVPEMAKDMKAMGIRPVVTVSWDGGAYFSNRPVRKVEDFKGLRWRTHAPMLSQVITEMGGSTVGMPFGELAPSLEKGLVDAYTTTFPAMYAANLHKVTKYAIMAPNGTSLATVMVSEKALERLPENVRKNVEAELAAIDAEVGKALHREFIDTVSKVRASGVEVITFSPEESAKVAEAAHKAVWTEWLEKTGPRGKALLEQVRTFKK